MAFKGPSIYGLFSRFYLGFKTKVDRSKNRRNGTKTELGRSSLSVVIEDPVVFLRWLYSVRRPAPELIERHFAGHVGGGGAQAAAAASGVVEGVLLLLLPEPFIVVVLLSLF